ncbi:winged helix-turn-helix transcriptional regulator [archaeon]|nr:winged helix-turn-helix transcriptional regulator [archaeon]
MKQFDELDLKILEVLKENSKLSFREISKITKINPTTVMQRIKKMENKKIIRNYTVDIDYKKLNVGISAYILISNDYNLIRDQLESQGFLSKQLAQFPFVSDICSIAGEKDIIIKIRAQNLEELNKFIVMVSRMKGIRDTVTLMILKDVSADLQSPNGLIKYLRNKI